MQNWTAKKVYFYAVSLVLLLLILFNVGSLLWQLVSDNHFTSPDRWHVELRGCKASATLGKIRHH